MPIRLRRSKPKEETTETKETAEVSTPEDLKTHDWPRIEVTPWKVQPAMKDITAPKVGVQIQVREDGQVVWVNIDGVCVLRVSQVPLVEIDTKDQRFFIAGVSRNAG